MKIDTKELEADVANSNIEEKKKQELLELIRIYEDSKRKGFSKLVLWIALKKIIDFIEDLEI